MRVGFVPPVVLSRRGAVARSSAEALRRFSSGDLQSECDEGEVDPYTGRPATTSQPKPQNQRPASQGKFLIPHLRTSNIRVLISVTVFNRLSINTYKVALTHDEVC